MARGKKETNNKKRKYHVPGSKELGIAIVNVLRENPVVSSQEKMLGLVKRELRETDSKYTITGNRLRKVAMTTGHVIIETKCRDTRKRRNVMVCPVCTSRTDIVKNRTLDGGVVSLLHQCPVCNYWSGVGYRIPIRYRFLLKSPVVGKGTDSESTDAEGSGKE